jgi:hypothetical protein
MKVSKVLSSLGDHLQVGASVRNVYGEPVSACGRMVIPVAAWVWLWGRWWSEPEPRDHD